MHKKICSCTMMLTAALWVILPAQVHAAPAVITYTDGHHIFTIAVTAHPEWRHSAERWFYKGIEAIPPARLLSCGTEEMQEANWTKKASIDWDVEAIRNTIDREIGTVLNRPAGSVVISRSASGTIVFEGRGLTGRKIDLPLAALLTKTALEQEVGIVTLPMIETQPAITVNDPDLTEQGIREVVTIGESVFAKSPVNRRHNIATGVSKFNGHLIPKDAIFSFNETLGPVNEKTGYRKELVIQGETTIPDYGGGLCQVSSTAYRGPWEYGMPIVQRKNHSYAVSYYSPQGTDATIYPPNVDMKFRNDTPGSLLIQSFTDENDRAFFIYYGTRDKRVSEVFGPYITDRIKAPKTEKIVYTTDIPVGEKRKAGELHDGMNAIWYRNIKNSSGKILEFFFSSYEARPATFQIGVRQADIARHTAEDLSDEPSWLPSKP